MFYKNLKYVITVLFILVVVAAGYNFSDSEPATAEQQTVATQPSQSKFNF